MSVSVGIGRSGWILARHSGVWTYTFPIPAIRSWRALWLKHFNVSRTIAKLQTNDRIQAVAAAQRRRLVYLHLRVSGDSRLRGDPGSTGMYFVGFSLTCIAAGSIMMLRHDTLAAGTMQGSLVQVMGDHFARDADELDREYLEQVEASPLGRIRYLTGGEVLHWQGDPVEYFFICTGSLKEHPFLPHDRACAHRVLGMGGLLGATAHRFGHDHGTTTQALDKVKTNALQLSELDSLVTRKRSHDICLALQ